MSERKLPSLNALRAFAVVGKQLNLKTAADILLSHQVH